MGKQITLQRRKAKRGRAVYIAGASLVGILIIGIWAFQFGAMLHGGVISGISTEFTETFNQVETSLELAEEQSVILGSPLGAYDVVAAEPRADIPDEHARRVLEVIAGEMGERMNKDKYQTLPLSPNRYAEEE